MKHIITTSLVLILFFNFTISSKTFNNVNVTNYQKETTATIFHSIGWPLKHKFAAFLLDLNKDGHLFLDNSCRQQLFHFANGLKKNRQKSLRMYDSFAKFKPGLLSNRFTDFGHYEQCLKHTKSRYVILQVDIEPGYEKIYFKKNSYRHFIFQKPIVAICVPSTCSESNVSSILKSHHVTSIIHPYKLQLVASELLGENSFDSHQTVRTISRLILLSIVTANIIATIFTKLRPIEASKYSIITCFDLIKNTKAIFQPIRPEHSRTTFFNGFRTMYLLFAISGHLLVPMSPALRPYYHPIIQSFLSDDIEIKSMQLYSFMISVNFVVSSALNVISWMPALEVRKGDISFISYLMIRVLRTYPVVITFLLLLGSFPWITSLGGPLTNYMQKTSIELMVKNGWKELLFISNFQHPNQMVIVVGWFISSDMQLYTFSFIIIYYLYKKPKIGITLGIISMISGILLQLIYLIKYDVSPTSFIINKQFHVVENLFQMTHTNSINYVSSYAIGLLFGYLIYCKLTMSLKLQRIIYWTSIISLVITSILPIIIYDTEGNTNYSRISELIFGIIYKPLICIALCALLYVCSLKCITSSWIIKFSSCNYITVISRLSFSMFLVHPIQILFLISSDREAVNYSQSDIKIQSLYIIITCFFYGYLMHVFVEAPFYRLTRMLSESKSSKLSYKVN